jgi:hypothetical protein
MLRLRRSKPRVDLRFESWLLSQTPVAVRWANLDQRLAPPTASKIATVAVGQIQAEGYSRDPPEVPRPSPHHHPPRGNARRLRPSAARPLGRNVCGTCPAPVRVGATLRHAASPGDRAGSGMGARRDHDVSSACGCRPRQRGCSGVDRRGTSRRTCCRSSRGGGARRRPRARGGGLRDQGGARSRS